MFSTRSHAARRLLAAAAAVALLGLAACTDDGAHAAIDTTPATTEAAALTTPPTTPTEAPATTSAPTTTAGPTTTEAASAELIKVSAEDFAFDGVPAELAPGRYRFAFANLGTEPHELLIFRNPEGLSLEQLFALGPAEALQRIEKVALLTAGPGSSAKPEVVELAAGEYEVVCFIPTPIDDTPHFTHGMHAKITVA